MRRVVPGDCFRSMQSVPGDVFRFGDHLAGAQFPARLDYGIDRRGEFVLHRTYLVIRARTPGCCDENIATAMAHGMIASAMKMKASFRASNFAARMLEFHLHGARDHSVG